MTPFKILIACEESQTVCKAFRAKGHEAYSCDILYCSGGHPEWHIQGDVLGVLNGGMFITSSGQLITIHKWDMIIAFPPCTYLTVTANKWMKPEFEKRFPTRKKDRQNAIRFFKKIAKANCPMICIENPKGIMSTEYRNPDQLIHPYYFGDEAKKATFLWLKGLPKLTSFKEDDLFNKKTHVGVGEIHTTKSGKNLPKWYSHADQSKGQEERAKLRSKTFPGIANAMACQWGSLTKDQAQIETGAQIK